MSRLSIRDLVVGYETEAVLRGITFDVPHGALLAIVGPSGCGKTTLLRTIAGLMRARSGEIRLDQRMVTTHGIHLAPEKRRVGWVPQDAALFPHLTVAENVAFGLGNRRRGLRAAARDEKVQHLLELVGLAALADRTPSQLSGGQAQRVALARALASDPEVVLLDEPFGALDPLLRGELRREVRALLAAEGTTGILVTHDQAEALSTADYVAVMNDGEVLQFGRPEDVYERPTTPWVATFVGDSMFLGGTWHSGFVECSLGRLGAEWVPGAATGGGVDGVGREAGGPPVPEMPGGLPVPDLPGDGDLVRVLVRPEQLELTSEPDFGSLEAVVTAISYTGHDALLDLRLVAEVQDGGAAVGGMNGGSAGSGSLGGGACTARVPASGLLPVGAQVSVAVRGRVLAYALDI